MTSRRGSISDYPEHLNPFYEGNQKFRFWKFGKVKRSGSFGESLRNTVSFKSFRGKKKDKQAAPPSPPELRRNIPRTETQHRQTLPTTLSPIYSPARSSVQIALPRSRFSERVAKSTTCSENGNVPSETVQEQPTNPFGEDEKVAELKPKRIRRRKRRAPLPPNATREEGDAAYFGMSSAHNLSKWSLTSVETDISIYSESENLALDLVTGEISEMMNNITKEMEKMTDETNNSPEPTKDTSTEKSLDVPDLIASSTESTKYEEKRLTEENLVSEVTQTESNENVKESAGVISVDDRPRSGHTENPVDKNSNIVPRIKCDNNENIVENVTSCDKEAMQENYGVSSRSDCDNSTNSVSETSKTEILYNTTYDHVSSEQDVNFIERKSIYITASNNQLDKSESLSNSVNNIKDSVKTEIKLHSLATPPTSPRCRTKVTMILTSTPQESIQELEGHETEDDKKRSSTNWLSYSESA